MSSPGTFFLFVFFVFNDTATTEIYTLSLHDALPISGGRRRGAVAGCVVGAASLATLSSLSKGSVDSPVLLVLAGIAVGHVARLNVDASVRLERAIELEAATRERDRLARGIHDSVLQV